MPVAELPDHGRVAELAGRRIPVRLNAIAPAQPGLRERASARRTAALAFRNSTASRATRTIEIDEFVERDEIDTRCLIRPYYPRPDGKVGHDAFAVIRETIREMNKVAIGRVVLTNREHIIALERLDKGRVGTFPRYPYGVRSADEYFDEIQEVKVTKDMLELASQHIVNQTAGTFEPEKFEDQYETALVDLINQKRAGRPITPKERTRHRQRRQLDGGAAPERRQRSHAGKAAKPAKKPRKAAAGQKENSNADRQRRKPSAKVFGRPAAF